jgi:hypothetical protein
MQPIIIISGRFVSILILGFVGCLFIPVAHAGYLTGYVNGPAPVFVQSAFVEPVECLPCCKRVHKHHYKKHRAIKHRKHHKVYKSHCRSAVCSLGSPVCNYRYHPQHEPVAFVAGAPAGRGCYVNLFECDAYAPDMTTGDDDPMIYPGMNIDN